MTDRVKIEEQIRKLERKQNQALQSLVKPLSTAFHGPKAKACLDVAVKKIKADKLKKEKLEKEEKLKKEKK